MADLCPRLIERFYGAVTMATTARYMLLDAPGREQRYYKTFPMSTAHGDAAIAKAQNLIHAAEAKHIPLTMPIAESGLERRTFLRRFRKATEMTSSEYLQRVRVQNACDFLQFNSYSIEYVAWDSGCSGPSAFRRVFAKLIGLIPGEYRRRFATSVGQLE